MKCILILNWGKFYLLLREKLNKMDKETPEWCCLSWREWFSWINNSNRLKLKAIKETKTACTPILKYINIYQLFFVYFIYSFICLFFHLFIYVWQEYWGGPSLSYTSSRPSWRVGSMGTMYKRVSSQGGFQICSVIKIVKFKSQVCKICSFFVNVKEN